MIKARGKRSLWILCGALGGVSMLASVARAEVSTDLSGTVLVYPKVVWDGTRDTIIQLASKSNLDVLAHCTYINGAPRNGGRPGRNNPPSCQLTDFNIHLTRQQPTHWVVSAGRPVDPSDELDGKDPGPVPPVPLGFTGALHCVQTALDGSYPFAGNDLRGEAVLRSEDGDVTKYNAVAILATDAVAGDGEIRLNNTPFNDGEANSCHQTLLLNHFADGTPDPVVSDLNSEDCVDGNCPIRTSLTLIPCHMNFETTVSASVTVQFDIVNEFENHFSASTTVQCWADWALGDIAASSGRCSNDEAVVCGTDDDCADGGDGYCVKRGPFSAAVLGSTSALTRITPVDRHGGVIGVAEESHRNSSNDLGTAAWDLHAEGAFADGRFFPKTRYDAIREEFGGDEAERTTDTMVLPAQQ